MKPIAQGKHIYIRSVCDDDFSFLYSIFNDTEELYLWSNYRDAQSFSQFELLLKDMLKNVYRHFYIVCENEKCRKIGFLYCYNAHMNDGYVYTTAFVIDEYRKTLCGAEAGLLYYAHLFRYYNYRKIYSEVYSYNEESKCFLESAGFEIEGILKKHRYYLDDFYDLYIFSINRDFFFKKYDKLIEHFLNAIKE